MQTKLHILNKKKVNNISLLEAVIPNGVDIIEELIAEDGYKLTESYEVDITKRSVFTRCFLGKGRNASEWKEITDEEANEIFEEHEKLRKEHEKEGTI